MHQTGLHSKTKRKYKATTNSHHNLPVAENLLNRDFEAASPTQKMVSDITYISTDEGWLYVAGILDLCGRKMVGLSMGDRMTKELVIAALNDTHNRVGYASDCILHSDRGSQYCATAYQEKLRQYGFKCSMSRKGNCWDNAPMESFWSKLKIEWLNDQHFHTRTQARSAVFEYVWIYYNRQRLHATNGYITPEDYYYRAKPRLAA